VIGCIVLACISGVLCLFGYPWFLVLLAGQDIVPSPGGWGNIVAGFLWFDLINAPLLLLGYGAISDAAFQASEANLVDFVRARGNTKPHLLV
jgi:hypothetical protein